MRTVRPLLAVLLALAFGGPALAQFKVPEQLPNRLPTLPSTAPGSPGGRVTGDAPEDLIIGKWRAEDPPERGTVEFTRDGRILVEPGDSRLQVRYKVLPGGAMDVTIRFEREEQTNRCKYRVTESVLEITYETKTLKLRRER
jgi:hypothetical protein